MWQSGGYLTFASHMFAVHLISQPSLTTPNGFRYVFAFTKVSETPKGEKQLVREGRGRESWEQGNHLAPNSLSFTLFCKQLVIIVLFNMLYI